jgi:diguanylate cyclase (GGDEF)-like protein
MNNQLYQLVAVPVLAPLPVAWLVLGFRIDGRLAHNLRSLTLLEISFATRDSPASAWHTPVSTLATEVVADLPTALAATDLDRDTDVTLVTGGDDYLARVVTMPSQSPQVVVAILQRSMRQALDPVHRLQRILVGLGVASLLAGIAASLALARGITRPIASLATLADNIAKGDYSQAADATRGDEVGQLASAFNLMREGISQRESRITDLAFRDQLTGLPNRALFNERLDQAIGAAGASQKPFSVLLLDLDRFKEVNNILGHRIGDLLLKEIGARLTGALANYTDTVARLGGDEFAVLLPNANALGAQAVVRKLLDVVELPVELERQQVVSGASIGIAEYPTHGADANTLMRHADLAMYLAKDTHSGYAVFDEAMVNLGEEHLSLMAELRHAVENDELVLFYQPKVNLANGTLGHVEALVRWRHPKRGLVAPGEFIPFAERTGYIRAITAWALEEAVRQRCAWQQQGLALVVSVNISARDLMKADLPELLSGLLARYGASPGWIMLEITESAIMSDPARAQGVLERLRRMGVRLSVDDYGTGHSSLAYLKKLPVSELKIDMSFVRNMDHDHDDQTIVRSTIELGHNMGLTIVAEGVESAAILAMLVDMGCDLAQGYHLSKPIPADALVKWIGESNWRVVGEPA